MLHHIQQNLFVTRWKHSAAKFYPKPHTDTIRFFWKKTALLNACSVGLLSECARLVIRGKYRWCLIKAETFFESQAIRLGIRNLVKLARKMRWPKSSKNPAFFDILAFFKHFLFEYGSFVQIPAFSDIRIRKVHPNSVEKSRQSAKWFSAARRSLDVKSGWKGKLMRYQSIAIVLVNNISAFLRLFFCFGLERILWSLFCVVDQVEKQSSPNKLQMLYISL